MLGRKSVSIVDTRMHLWNEIGGYVHAYDRRLDGEMCIFLDRMIALGTYALRGSEHQIERSAA